MSFTTWTLHAVSSEGRPWLSSVWRMVEAQHIASTMKIVDNGDEQDLLETLLEQSKPAPPEHMRKLHYLLATPFRYTPLHRGSRFRDVIDPGVFYGAESVRTAAAELGFWRWKFLKDAVALDRLEPVAHTAFKTAIATTAVDLRLQPFASNKTAWKHPDDYTATQAFARVARAAGIGAIVYQSVRDPQPAWCLALLAPDGFARPKPHARTQIWFLAVSKESVTWRRENETWQFSATSWTA